MGQYDFKTKGDIVGDVKLPHNKDRTATTTELADYIAEQEGYTGHRGVARMMTRGKKSES